MDKVLTVIVPSYHTQAYIDQCIPTMLKHSYMDELELLLINDGSKDHTLEKLERYAGQYPDTVTVIDKENGGHGSVINLGIQKAKGAYVKVVDGDDWVIPENFGNLIRQLAGCKADLVVHPYVKCDVHKKKKRVIRFPLGDGCEMPFDQAAPKLHQIEIQAVTYRTALLQDHAVRVRENCFYEDTEFNIYPARYVKTVCIFSDPVYVYRIGTASQSIAPGQAFANRRMHQAVVDDCIAYFEKNRRGLSKAKQDYMAQIINRRIRSHYMIYVKNSMTALRMRELETWDEELKRKSAYFYQASGRFPVGFLRLHIRRTYPFVKILYMLYQRLRIFGV